MFSTGRQHIYNKDIENTNNITSPSEDFKNMFNLIEKRSKNIIQIEYIFAPLRDCCQKQYEKIACVNVASVCFDSSISKYIWEIQRKFRITGSRCYSLYTYTENKNPNWQIKSNKYFSNATFSNKFVRHGIKYEPIAKTLYLNSSVNCKIFEPGLYASNKNPWLGYSADGVVFEFGKPIKLLEIKCPFLGKTAGIKEVLKKCKYISIVKGIYTLKNRHPYYGQIQLAMYLFNLRFTDFCLYCSFDNRMFVITVLEDEKFIFKMLSNLKINDFNNMLHNICLDIK